MQHEPVMLPIHDNLYEQRREGLMKLRSIHFCGDPQRSQLFKLHRKGKIEPARAVDPETFAVFDQRSDHRVHAFERLTHSSK